MIVLHVARARTDSINIRGSFGKTWAALWITGATFLYFSGCNAHTPFTLFLFSPPLSLSLFSFRRLRRVSSKVVLYPPVIVLCYSLLPVRNVTSFLSRSYTPLHLSLSLSLSIPLALSLFLFHFRPISTHDSLPFNGTDRGSSLPRSELLPPD